MGALFDGLITWSIRHRAVVLLLAVGLMVASLATGSRASLDVLPDFMPPRVVVQTEAPGMGTLDVEETVTRPIERVLLGTPSTTTVRSTSSQGLSVVTLLFEDGVDVYRARQLVAERIELARARLPMGVRAPQLAPISAPIGALLKLCISVDPGTDLAHQRELRAFGDWTLRPRLLAIPGVSQVTVHGGEVERVEVRPDPSRLRARRTSMDELLAGVQGAQAPTGAGFAETATTRLDVKTAARLSLDGSVSAISDAVVAVRDGLTVRVGDVADVVNAGEPRVGAALYDGRPAIYVQINKLPWADTLTVTASVEAALADLAPRLPSGARVEPPVFRQADFIRTSVWSVSRAMLLGAVLVVLVLVAFLRHGRLAAISLTAIPLSILAAAAALVASGVSINGMTLGGLAIAVGEVVDDAIVDVENVWRRLRENARRDTPRPVLDVVHDASREVRGSVVYATVIVCLVLLPVLLLGGIAGRIFAPLAQAYILAIVASLLVALTVTPAMCAWLLPRLATKEASPTRLATWLLARYRRVLSAAIARPRAVLGSSAVLAIAALITLPFLGGRFLPEFHEGSLIAHVHAAPGASLDESMRLAGRVDAGARPTVASHVSARAGRAELDEDAAPIHRIEMDFVLRPGDDREWEEIVLDVARRIGQVPGLGFVVEGFLGERIHEVLSGETAPVVVKVVGPDLTELRRLAGEVARVMEETPGLGMVRVEPQIDVPQLRVVPDRAALARAGVRTSELADAVVEWRQGRSVAQLLEPTGRVVDVALAGPPALRARSALGDIPVSTRAMGDVTVSSLATLDEVPAPSLINHEGGERRISIGASASGASLSTVVERLEDRLRQRVHAPPGYRIDLGGEGVARSQAGTRLVVLGVLGLVGIFVLLAVAFGSLRDASIVLLNIPLGLVGGVVAAALTPEGLSVSGFVGFVTLFGIITRNGIMLVAHKRQLDVEAPDEDAVARVLRAAEERLLPILMTAATAGLALLPLAVSFEFAGSELEAPMALIVCGGLITSTVLNMIVLPTVYVWLERRRAPLPSPELVS